jgi:hypothetical protein
MASIKRTSLLTRRPDLTHEQFLDHYLNVHGPLALRITLFDRYVQNHRVLEPVAGLPHVADALPFNWMISAEALASLRQDPAYLEGAFLDEKKFMDGPSVGGAAVEEDVVFAGAGPLRRNDVYPKLLVSLKRRDDLAPEAFRAALGAVRHPLFERAGGLRRFLRDHVIPGTAAAGEPPHDALEEVWYESEAACRDALAGPQSDAIRDLCRPGGVKAQRVLEYRLRWPDPPQE